MTSISSVNNSAALTILKTVAQSSANLSPQDRGGQMMEALAAQGYDPLTQAADAIIRIVLENGGEFIAGGAFSQIQGTGGDDIIYAAIGSSVNGGAGNDYISIGPSSSANGGAGDDQIQASFYSQVSGSDGNDTIEARGNMNVIDGGDGDDIIRGASDNVISGGAGNDTINAGAGSKIDGGTGDDIIYLDGKHRTMDTRLMSDNTGSTLQYAIGDGKDTLHLKGTDSTLKLGAGLSAENTQITISGKTATISFSGNETDQITVDLSSDSSLTVQFSDGTTASITPQAEVSEAPETDAAKLARASAAFAAYAEH